MKLTARHVEKLRASILACDASAVTVFLEEAESFDFSNLSSLIGLHDALLLLEAYPPSVELYERATILLRAFDVFTKRYLRRHKSASAKLVNSGLKGTEIQGAFTYPMLHALRKQFPAYLFLHSFDEEGPDCGSVLRHFLPAVEFEAVTAEAERDQLLDTLYGKGDHLVHIIDSLSADRVPAALRDQLFDQLKIYAGIILDGKVPDRTSARGLPAKPYIHTEILKKLNPQEVIAKALPAAEKLTKEQEQKLVLHSMCMLATLNRETDPISTCAENGVTLFQLERGVSVALFSMEPERRMPLESYIGYMLYKNGVPQAYGGAWIFGNRALFGINIFEPFRGGESSNVILQLLRVYHQHFGVTAFSVEPYQYGEGNPEGIESGAYWFYYKLGFRSDDKKLAALAEKEMKKMKAGKHRSSHATLRKFTGSRITWKVNPNVQRSPDPSALSRFVTDYVCKYYAGNRQLAIASIRNKIGADAEGIPDDYILAFLNYRGNRFLPLMLPEQVKELWESKLSDERRYNAILASLLTVNQ